MKKLTFILSWLVIFSFNTSNGSSPAISKSDSTATSVTPAANKGTITCTIDGKSKTFQVHNAFFEIKLDPDKQAGPNDGVELLDGSATTEGFQFEIKNKGTSVFKGMEGVLNMISYFNAKGADYVAFEGVTAAVTSFDGNHLTGTFSGKFQNTNFKGGSDGNPEFVQITGGRFDLNR